MTVRDVHATMTTSSTGRQANTTLQTEKTSLKDAKANDLFTFGDIILTHVKEGDALLNGESSTKTAEADQILGGQSHERAAKFKVRQLSENKPTFRFGDILEKKDKVDMLRMSASESSAIRWSYCSRTNPCGLSERGETCGVVASTDIPAHVKAGPYPGRLDFGARTSDRQSGDNSVKVAWQNGRLVTDGDNDHGHHFLSNHPNHPNSKLLLDQESESGMKWMLLLQPARDRLEQNVEVVSEGGYLVLRVVQPIRQGERLLLWYSESLARTFGVPILTPAHIRGDQQYTCTSCNTTFQYPNTLKAHILFKCTSALPLSPRLTSASTFTTRTFPSHFIHHFGCGPSAFQISALSPAPNMPCSLTGSSVRMQSEPILTARRDRNESMVSSEITNRKISSTPDRRSVTPDSSTDENSSAQNPSINNFPRSSGSSLSSSATHFAVLHSSSITAGNDPNPLPTSRPDGYTHPIQICNNTHSPGLPIPPLLQNQHMNFRLCYPWLAALPAADSASAKTLCASAPDQNVVLDHRSHLGVHSAHHYLLHHQQLHQSGNIMFSPHLNLDFDPQSLIMTSSVKPYNTESDHGMVTPIVSQPLPESNSTLTNRINRPLSGNYPDSRTVSGFPFLFVPTEKKGEPLDLSPPSLLSNKSRKGHLCLYCGKLYSRKYGLKIHLRTHTGYKPLKCKVCFRPFGDPSNLNKHVRLHAEGDTPYRCDYCGKVLVRRRDLERHIRSRHPLEDKEDDDISTEFADSEIDVTSDTESAGDDGEQEIEVA